MLARSSYVTTEQIFVEQPLQFSHMHQVTDDGIDCRYCHTSVEASSFAGIPPTKTRMNCHSVIFANASFLEPVRASFRDRKPLHWVRVHDPRMLARALESWSRAPGLQIELRQFRPAAIGPVGG